MLIDVQAQSVSLSYVLHSAVWMTPSLAKITRGLLAPSTMEMIRCLLICLLIEAGALSIGARAICRLKPRIQANVHQTLLCFTNYVSVGQFNMYVSRITKVNY